MLACSVAAWCALAGCAQAQSPAPAPPASTASRDVAATARTYLAGKLAALATRADGVAPLYASRGRWRLGGERCKRCVLGGAVAAATLAGDAPRMRDLAQQTVDRFVATQLPDGAFPSSVPPGRPDGIETEFAGVQIGTVAHLLDGRVSKATSARWAESLRSAGRYLVASGMTTYYVNGNVNLGTTLTLGLAWQATRDPALKAAYERSWDFTLHPPAPRWAAYGLRFVKAPRRADWADGAGYLAEAGARPGFDAHYTQLQASLATRMWLTLGDPRALRLANVLTNQLLKHVDGEWHLDTGGGSRHPVEGLSFPFITASVAATDDCRAGGRSVAGQFAHIESWFDRNLDVGMGQNDATWLFYLGNDVATFAMLDARPACPGSGTAAARRP
jgi:hypothetical protein